MAWVICLVSASRRIMSGRAAPTPPGLPGGVAHGGAGTAVARLLWRGEDDVSLGVRDRGPGGDVPDGAHRRAADVDGLGAALGGDEKVAGPDSGPRQVRRGQLQDGVVAWVLVARREAIGKVGGGCPRWYEPGGLH